MLRVVVFAVLLLFSPPLGAASIHVRLGAGAGSCGSERDFRRSVEIRLGVALDQMANAPQQIETEFYRSGKAWVAKISMRDGSGAVLGDRALRVNAEECRVVEEYAALTISLMIEAEAVPTTPAIANGPAEAVPGEPAVPEPTPEPIAAPVAPAVRADRTWGTGPERLQLFRSLMFGPSLQPALAREAIELLASGLRERLLPSGLFTIIEPGLGIERFEQIEPFVRQTMQDQLPGGSADHALIPIFHALALQRGLDFSFGERADAVMVVVHCSILPLSHRFHRVWPPLDIRVEFALRGKLGEPGVRQLALRLALERVVEVAMEGLRKYPPFRLRLALSSSSSASVELKLPALADVEPGDTFVFEGDDGQRTGLVSIAAINGNSATANVYAAGSGSRLSERGKYRPMWFGVHGFGAWRAAYRNPSAANVERANASGRYPRELGAGADLGVGLDLLYVPRVSPLRAIGVIRVASADGLPIASESGSAEISAGLAYELALSRSVGLTLSPHLRGGLEWLHGAFGPDGAYWISNFRALTANVGFALSFYRASSWTALFGFEYQAVRPLRSSTPASAFLDDKFPAFDALIFSAGVRSQPLDVTD